MKAIDFTHTGGFPLTQDELDYLQQAYTECINAIAVMGGAGPTLITGMSQSFSLGVTTVAGGWFFYNGEMIKYLPSTYSALGFGDVVLVNITPTAANLTYNDGSTYGAVLNKTAVVSVGPSVTSATQFPLSLLQPFQVAFGQNGRETTWNSTAVSTPAPSGGVTGTIFYKKDMMANTLQIRGFLTASNAQNFAASPSATYSLMCTLPVGYRPNNNTFFTSIYFISGMIEDDLGVAWIKQVNSAVNTTGDVYINWIKPHVSVLGYGLEFNTIIPLD